MLAHLIELRKRLFHTLIFFILVFIVCFNCSESLFHGLTAPLLDSLPKDSSLIATQMISTVYMPIKLAFYASAMSSLPFLLYQIWRFTAPGLHRHERRFFRAIMLFMCLLFLAGLFFCYYLVIPMLFHFFVNATPESVQLMPDMALSIDFILYMMMLFGLSFQLPLVCFALVRCRILSFEQLKAYRPYFIVAAFSMGMLLTPPDVLSQLCLAIPLCLLYELAIALCRLPLEAR